MISTGESAPATSTIAVIDDNQGVRAALCNLLDSAGYHGHGFASAELFLASDCPLHVACAVVDIELVQMNGFELLEQLIARHVRMPVILMSAHGGSSNKARAAQLGAVDMLVKPIHADTLLACIDQAISASGSG